MTDQVQPPPPTGGPPPGPLGRPGPAEVTTPLVPERRLPIPAIDRRRVVLIVVALVAVTSALGGWLAGQRIKSPAEIAAETDPPDPSLITVPVELRELSHSVVVRGTVRASDATEVPALSTEGTAVITRLPKAAGDLIDEGDVVVEISGRPMIALQGKLPAFRNLIPSLEGPDVTQLQEALVRLGHDPGPVDGVYDASTAAAVEDLYTAAGYSPPEPPEADQAELTAARELVAAQEQALSDAKAAVAEASKDLPESQRLSLDQAVTDAQNQLTITTKTAEQSKADAAKAIEDATAADNAAQAAATSAAERLAQAEGGTHPDTGQPPTQEELATLRDEDRTAKAEAASAADALGDAIAAQELIEVEQASSLDSAATALEIARATRSETLAASVDASLRDALDNAEEALAEAREDLAEANAKIGAWIPVEEVLFLSSAPREVQSLAIEVGDKPDGIVMTVTGAETIVESGISAADRKLIAVGDEAVLEDDALGISVPAVVTAIADSPGGPDLSADRYAMGLEPTEELPDEALNVNLRIAIPISSSGGEVLAVPFAALSAGSDGTARVEIERASGETELVEVSTGLRAEGFVQVEPLGGASLAEDDRVVVGRDLQLPGAAAADEGDDDGGGGDDPAESSAEDGGS